MTEATPKPSRSNWTLPLGSALVVVAVYLWMVLWTPDAAFFASALVVAPALLLITVALVLYALVVWKDRQKRLTLLSTVAALWVSSLVMFLIVTKYDLMLSTSARWLIWSHHYKAQVLAQPHSTNGDFKHIKWDSWGIVPAGFTTVYLIFDPSDSLSSAAKMGRPGKFSGIPCAVPKVNRLGKDWYTVQFYTDEDWEHCEYD